ncbi:DNA-binding protein [Pseudomonas sp. S25]|uniref:DNA-binding protein n=1 Tax=Pseudomonas maioricensis TaxID=1766623 RepID=A0ABS9ZMM2_9PSED|nr:KilA-N domain-containing protein [Pseudomonas sp. S25]MCI8210782.1 DNA-binding protein [Pseudomonas sp. S25]
MNSAIIPFAYEGQPVRFNSDGWINATDVAKWFGKKPAEWVRLPASERYIAALAKALHIEVKEGLSHFGLIATDRGGRTPGTWLHPKLAVAFARWLDDDFAVWCDLHIDALIHGELNEKQNFERACRALDSAQKVASLSGKELAAFRWKKPRLVHEVDYWRDQLQMTLGLDAA